MRSKITLMILLIFSLSVYPQAIIHNIIDDVNQDSLMKTIRILSGVEPVLINDSLQTIISRERNQPGNELAFTYLFQKLSRIGLLVKVKGWSFLGATGKNIYAIKTGSVYPNKKLLICAHYDNLPKGPIAPGADDNASGIAAVLEVARVLNNYDLPYTIIYALWDDGKFQSGARLLRDSLISAQDSLKGVINLDMIGYNMDNEPYYNIHTDNFSTRLSNKVIESNFLFNINLIPKVINPPVPNYSEHTFFLDRRFGGAILITEDANDKNPYINLVNDNITYLNAGYLTEITKLAIASISKTAFNYEFNITHTPLEKTNNTSPITTNCTITNPFTIGTNIAAPRLYYRTKYYKQFYSSFNYIQGVPIQTGAYSFTLPGQPLGTQVQYYIAAQDSSSTLMTTLPYGGRGVNPPGSVPPENLYTYYVASETTIFFDSASTKFNWSGNWGIDTNEYVSAPSSFNESPDTIYNDNSSYWLELKNPVWLNQNVIGNFLEFDAKWEIEYGYDYAQVQISTDMGANWIPLHGKYTNDNNPYLRTTTNIYDSSQNDWVKESMDITKYQGNYIKIKFILESDDALGMNGMFVDNIEIINLDKPTDLSETDIINTFYLSQNYPNPFNPVTNIKYSISKAGKVSLVVYDILGREVKTLVNEYKEAGTFNVSFNASELPSGTYFYKLSSGNYNNVKKMILLK